MAKAFSQKETDMILKDLKASARKCAISAGMRKITVEELAKAAGISKGAFYKFYPTKEMLFLELLEDLHDEIYEACADVLMRNQGKPSYQRTAEAVLEACKLMGQSGMMDFMEQDVPFLLRRIPAEVLEEHYHGDEVHIKALLENADLQPEGGMELTAATVRGLFLTVSHRDSIGPLYPQVLETLVYGACRCLFPEGSKDE